MDLTGIFTALIGLLEGLQPATILSIMANFGLGAALVSERKGGAALQERLDKLKKEADDRIDALKKEYDERLFTQRKEADERFDELRVAMQKVIDDGHAKIAELIRDGQASNKSQSEINRDTSEIIHQVAQSLATMAETFKEERSRK